MAKELKTKVNDESVAAFLDAVVDDQKRADAWFVHDLMARVTGEPARMWGTSIVGFGSYAYTNTTGKPAQWFLTGFSPRKHNLTLYIMPGYQFDKMQDLLSKLGKHKLGKSCLYLKRISEVDEGALEDIVRTGVNIIREKYDA